MKKLIAVIIVLMLLLTSCDTVVGDFVGGIFADESIDTEVQGDSPVDTGSTDIGSTDSGSTDSGSTDSGSTGSGSTDSGSTDSGSTDIGSTDSGSTDSGSTDSGSTGSGSTDSGSTGSGSTDSGSTGSGSTDSGSTDSGSTDSGSTDSGSTDSGSTDSGSTGSGSTDSGSTDSGSTDSGSTGSGSTDSGSTDSGSTGSGSTGSGSTDSGSTGSGSTDSENNQPGATHNYIAIETAPTCDKAGYTTYTCSECGDSYTADSIQPLGHTSGTAVQENKIAATCTKSGSYDSVVYCTVCDDEVSRNTVTVTSQGHTNETVSGYAATCTASGLTDGVICSVCKITITVQTTIDPLGHSWQDATTEAPKTCTVCGATEGDKLPSSGTTTGGYSDTLYISYINVGQGDSILIEVGDCDILIDAGTASYGSTVSSYLTNRGVDDIELMINTHPDSDHCGGLTKVLNNFVVEQVWISKDTSKDTAAYKNFISAVGSEGLTAKKPNAGAVFTYEYLTLTVLYSSVGSDANNSSIVVMLEYGSFRFLFTGDIGEEVETKLVSSGADLSCDVLKVGHHGSKYSSTAAFLSATGADYGVISVGSNSYGHPTSDALTRLSNAGVSVYRTDLYGDILFSTDGATLTLPGGSSVGGGSGSSGGSSSGGSSSGGSSSGGSSSSTQYFIGNTESKVFHLPTCSNLPSASKQNTMYDYWWIINIAGYTPCGRCLKNYTAGTTGYIANTQTKVYHLSTCSNLPSASNQTVIYDTTGYTPCGRCLKSSASTTAYIANTESNVYHISTCSNLPAESKQKVIYDTTGYTPCGRCIGG